MNNTNSLLPVLVLPSLESIIPCKNCDRDIQVNALVLACSNCRLKQLGVQVVLAKGLHKPIFSGDALKVKCSGPNMIINRWNINHFSGRYESLEVVARVFFYTRFGQVESSWPMVGVGREVGIRRESYAPVITEWIRACRDEHPACPRMVEEPLQKRVLDIGSLGDPELVLIETIIGQSGIYFALSHCWGGGIEIRTKKANIETHYTGIRFSDLPRTFQDAVTVTRGIGVRYLWIDALCIIQDDDEDWEVESGNMAAIYQNARIVLSADKSTDSCVSFLDVEPGGYHGPPGTPVAVVKNDSSFVYARVGRMHHNPCPVFREFQYKRMKRNEPLAERAWTLQEKLLATRTVHFSAKEMVWQCRTSLSCECMEMDQVNEPAIQPDDDFSLAAAMLSPSPAWSVSKFRIWYKIVNEVVYRNITNPDDILPCLSGLARRFQDAGAGPFLAGLWLDDILVGLLWQGTKNGSRLKPYRAPSWSWASVGPWGSFGKDIPYQCDIARITKAYAKILAVVCTPKGRDPLGAVSDGFLKLAALLVPMYMVESYTQGSNNSINLMIRDTETRSRKINAILEQHDTGDPEGPMRRGIDIHNAYFDFEVPSNNNTIDLYCLFLLEEKDPYLGLPVRGLILQRRGDFSDGNTFERVGVFAAFDIEANKLLQIAEDSVVVII